VARTADERRAYQREWARANRADPETRAAACAKAKAKRIANPELIRAQERERKASKRAVVVETPIPEADLRWLAGLLEGEGCFGGYWHGRGPYFQPVIQLAMTDRDVVSQAAMLMGTRVSASPSDKRRVCKPMWRCAVSGSRAIQWMADLHALMGERRRQKIESVMTEWVEYQPPKRKATAWRHVEISA
jgi:hypothetical protein